MQISRRSFLMSSAAGAVGTAPLLGAVPSTRTKKLIVIYLFGGASQIDLWDPKPTAPPEYRGPFSSIPTNLSHVRVSELLPRMAQLMNRCVLIRSMNSNVVDVFDHSAAIRECLTGDCRLPAQDSSEDLRTFAAGIATDIGVSGSNKHVQLGFDQPVIRPYWSARSCDFNSMDQHVLGPTDERSSFERYCQSARDLVIGGCRIVEIGWDITIDGESSWDTHLGVEHATRLSATVLDRGLSQLLGKLERSQQLEDTIVAVTTEFGRHPLIGVSNTGNDTATGGRDHGRNHFSALLAGAGFPKGVVIGDTGPNGMSFSREAISPARLIAMLKSAMHGQPSMLVP